MFFKLDQLHIAKILDKVTYVLLRYNYFNNYLYTISLLKYKFIYIKLTSIDLFKWRSYKITNRFTGVLLLNTYRVNQVNRTYTYSYNNRILYYSACTLLTRTYYAGIGYLLYLPQFKGIKLYLYNNQNLLPVQLKLRFLYTFTFYKY